MLDNFQAIEMKIGTILTAETIEGADKLLKLSVDFGVKPKAVSPAVATDATTEVPVSVEVGVGDAPEERDIRQILSGIREYYDPASLVGKQCPFVTNLPPRTMRGLVSEGMILAVGLADGGAVLLHPDTEVAPGSTLR